MHGEIKLGRWLPFSAEEVIRHGRGFVWRADTAMRGVPIRGFDRLIDGEGAMRWRLLGLIPVRVASGPDISRSGIGRLVPEFTWLPSVLADAQVLWTQTNECHPSAHLSIFREHPTLSLTIGSNGRLQTAEVQRWANPNGRSFEYVSFGAVAEDERTFSGFTIPTRLRVGYYIDTDRFAPDGEFIRIQIDDAQYRR